MAHALKDEGPFARFEGNSVRALKTRRDKTNPLGRSINENAAA
jgi:hypothetical protein